MMKPSRESTAELNRRVDDLVQSGEGQHCEFMGEFPTNARELGKEVAAFATSNPGTILIGVDEAGFSLVGVELVDRHAKDEYLKRIDGICCGTVQPAVAPGVTFLEVAANRAVLVIDVPKGPEPVYYASHVPYVRHLTSSRPATPEEVKDAIVRWHTGRAVLPQVLEEEPENPVAEFAVEVAAMLSDTLLYLETMDLRSINPHFQTMELEFEVAAEALKEAAVSEPGREAEFKDDLLSMAQRLEKMARYDHVLGPESWRGFLALGAEATQAGNELRDRLFTVAGVAGTGEIAGKAREILQTILEVLDHTDSYDTEGLVERLAGEALVLNRLAFFLGDCEETKDALAAVSHKLVRLEVGPEGMGWEYGQEQALRGMLDELRRAAETGLGGLASPPADDS